MTFRRETTQGNTSLALSNNALELRESFYCPGTAFWVSVTLSRLSSRKQDYGTLFAIIYRCGKMSGALLNRSLSSWSRCQEKIRKFRQDEHDDEDKIRSRRACYCLPYPASSAYPVNPV
jgi:hypothetical protein